MASLPGARTLLGAPGIAIRSKDATRGLPDCHLFKPSNAVSGASRVRESPGRAIGGVAARS